MGSKAPVKRITKKVSLPSPTLQKFLKEIISNDDAYLSFLEDTPAALRSHGLELSADVPAHLLSDFRFAVDRARSHIKESKDKLRFEDVFRIPVVGLGKGGLELEPYTARELSQEQSRDYARTQNVSFAGQIYYSEQSSSENRGSSTNFSDGMTPTKSTDRWSTKNFGGTSIFEGDPWEERFDRAPLISAEVVTQIINSIRIK